MAKKIITVGFELAGKDIGNAKFSEKISLLDWDIVLFRPNISQYLLYVSDYYQGKPCLSDSNSFNLREACAHWFREIKEAVEAKKLVVVFLNKPEEIYVATGTHSTSGTGRNQKTTRHVAPFNNYEAIPVKNKWTITNGSQIILNPHYKDFLSSYWNSFGALSKYCVIWNEMEKFACLTTKHPNKSVGLWLDNEGGTLLLLPDLDFNRNDFSTHKGGGNYGWSDAGVKFSASLIDEIISISKAISNGVAKTVEPVWAKEEKFTLSKEVDIRRQLLIAETELEQARKAKDAAVDNLKEAGALRGLLYENGKPLETAIILALKVLGFSATQYQDDNSEFDAVFECAEGRLLGEAEGKDNKAINIDKLRQLSMNIHEDLDRDEVHVPAKGILFGNGYRLLEPSTRPTEFTDKCITSAASISVGLVRTSDLFTAAQYLSEEPNELYAFACRMAMIDGVGQINLPPPPVISAPMTNIDEEQTGAVAEESSAGSIN